MWHRGHIPSGRSRCPSGRQLAYSSGPKLTGQTGSSGPLREATARNQAPNLSAQTPLPGGSDKVTRAPTEHQIARSQAVHRRRVPIRNRYRLAPPGTSVSVVSSGYRPRPTGARFGLDALADRAPAESQPVVGVCTDRYVELLPARGPGNSRRNQLPAQPTRSSAFTDSTAV